MVLFYYDTHKKYGISLSSAKLIGVQVDQVVDDYFGAPTALIGNIARIGLATLDIDNRKGETK